MKSILSHLSQRYGYNGWALQVEGGRILKGTTCTTREEAREEKQG